MDLRFTDRVRGLLAEIRAENPSDTLVILVGGGCCENTGVGCKFTVAAFESIEPHEFVATHR